MTNKTQEYLKWLKDGNGYTDARLVGDAPRYAAICKRIYHYDIITGKIGDEGGFDDMWSYHTYADALKALNDWNGLGEPEGWHRNPKTGRRRDENGNIYVRW